MSFRTRSFKAKQYLGFVYEFWPHVLWDKKLQCFGQTCSAAASACENTKACQQICVKSLIFKYLCSRHLQPQHPYFSASNPWLFSKQQESCTDKENSTEIRIVQNRTCFFGSRGFKMYSTSLECDVTHAIVILETAHWWKGAFRLQCTPHYFQSF